MPEPSARDDALLRRLAISLILLGCTISLMGCDAGFRVRGELFVQGHTEPACQLTLHDASKNDALRERMVRGGSFEELFTVSPYPRDYYLTITCTGVRQTFKSATFRAGLGRSYDNPVALGKIVLSDQIKRD